MKPLKFFAVMPLPSAESCDAEGFDLLRFTPRTERPDPCAQPLVGLVAPTLSSSTPTRKKP